MQRTKNSSFPVLSTWLGLATALLCGTAAAQSARIQKPARTAIETWHEPGLVAVKFQDGLRIRLRAGGISDEGTGALSNALDVLAGPARGQWRRTHELDEATLERKRDEAQLRSGRSVPDLNLEFRLRLDPDVDAAAAVDALNALAIVELAWPVARPAPSPLPPDFSAQQGYQSAAPGGSGTRLAWPLPGGSGGGQLPSGGGLGIQILDVEYAFNTTHVDLPPVTTLALPPGETPVNPFADDNHGTAVMGQIFARSNGFGISGGAYGAQPFFSFANTSAGYNLPAAISRGLNVLSSGDLLLIEQQAYGPNTPACCLTSTCAPGTDCQIGLVPSEWDLSVYNAIVNVVAHGITVVEAAGNGSQNLDAAVYSSLHAPFLPANDSGAILVGAGASPGGSTTDRSRLGTSNYGATVDLQGWGEHVTTLGYSDLYSAGGPNEWYTAVFAGTSSASGLVTVACAQLQSIHRALTGHPMAPETLRDRLRATGSPQTSGIHPLTQNIGPRPDVTAALVSLGMSRGCADDDAWNPGFFGPPARREAAIAYDSGRGRVVSFGGETATLGLLGDTWAWTTGGPPNGSWTQVAASGPSPRTYARMAYDRRRDRLVLFGGLTAGGMSGETWEFDGTSWNLRSSSGPGPMTLHAMAYDIARERVVLFATICQGGCSTYTWEWNGTSWTGFAGGPTGRVRAALAYDSDRQRLVLFGGELTGGVNSAETWERSGTTWTLVSASGPGARAGAGLVYDTGRRRSVLFGGHRVGPFALLGDAWEWNGLTWRQSLPLVLPDPRTYHAMAYHEARDTELVLGGTTPSEVTASVFHYRERADQPGIPFCFGDGSGAACPCANTSGVGACEGCLSSLGLGGKLRSSGRASLANDTVLLTGSDMPNGSALYFQGSVQQSGGAGVPFGDGLRCAGGSIFRLETQTNASGASSYPLPGQLSVSQTGLVLEPGLRTYQVWYRNAAAFCTGSTFNLTNGLQVVWGL